MQKYLLPEETHIGAVHITISDLDRSLAFYEELLGFQAHASDSGSLVLSAQEGRTLLALQESQHALVKPPRSTGLYHSAILLPTRSDLARALERLLAFNYPLQGASDHGVSEAVYLADPDGNGIEIYADRPRANWRAADGRLQMGTDPLDFDDLMAESEKVGGNWHGLPAGTTVGHIHLHVNDLDQAQRFYCDTLGFDLVLRYGPSALFVSAGGYHHHIDLNTWAGVGAPPPPANSVGLRYFTVEIPGTGRAQRTGWATTTGRSDLSRDRERPVR